MASRAGDGSHDYPNFDSWHARIVGWFRISNCWLPRSFNLILDTFCKRLTMSPHEQLLEKDYGIKKFRNLIERLAHITRSHSPAKSKRRMRDFQSSSSQTLLTFIIHGRTHKKLTLLITGVRDFNLVHPSHAKRKETVVLTNPQLLSRSRLTSFWHTLVWIPELRLLNALHFYHILPSLSFHRTKDHIWILELSLLNALHFYNILPSLSFYRTKDHINSTRPLAGRHSPCHFSDTLLKSIQLNCQNLFWPLNWTRNVTKRPHHPPSIYNNASLRLSQVPVLTLLPRSPLKPFAGQIINLGGRASCVLGYRRKPSQTNS